MLELQANTAYTLKIGPFIDETDGKTAETGLAIAQADVRLSKNGGDIAQKTESTSCAHDELGVYGCPIDTTDTNTEGILQLWVYESGALPVFHEYMVLAQAAYISKYTAKDTGYMDVNIKAISEDTTAPDNLEADYDGTGYVGGTIVKQADVTKIGSVAQSATDLKDLADTGYDPSTHKVQGVVLTDTCTTNTDVRGTDNAATETKQDIIDTNVDTLITQVGTAGAGLSDLGGMSTGMKAEAQQEATDALNAYDPPTKSEMDTAHALLTTPAQVATALTTYDAPTKAEMDTAHALLATPAQVATELGTYDAPTKAELDTAQAAIITEVDANETKIDTVDTVVDGIQTDLSNVTDGLGALKTEINANETKIDTVDTVVDGIQTDLSNGTDGLGALKALIDTVDGVVDAVLADTVEIQGSGFSTATDSLVKIHDDHAHYITAAYGAAQKALIDALPSGIAKGVELANFSFPMILSSDHETYATGKTLTEEISKDGGNYAACTNDASEIQSSGTYKITLTATELNANVVILRFTETDCDTTGITIITT